MKHQSPWLTDPNYDPDRLLDALQSRLCLKSDAALSRALGVSPTILSKVRHRRVPVAPWLMIQIHDVAQLSLDEIRRLMGVMRMQRIERPHVIDFQCGSNIAGL